MNKAVNIQRMILSAVLALTMAGCADDDLNDREKQPVVAPENYITVTTSISEVVDTRGALIGAATQLTDFGFFCSYTGKSLWNSASDIPNKMYNIKMTRNNTTGFWDYANGNAVEWDHASAADMYTFFAYAPFVSPTNGISVASLATDAGIPKLTYTVPTNVAHQPDLMIAVAKKNLHPTGHPVDLQMKHALTAIGFLLSGNGLKVTGISITGVAVSANLTMDGAPAITWSNHGAVTHLDLSTTISGGLFTTTNTPQNPITTDGFLMMIPQTLTGNAKLKVTFDNGQTKEFDLMSSSLPAAWEAGKKVIYSINLTPPA